MLILLNVFASLSENDLLVQITKPLFVPVLMVFYFMKNRYIHPLIIAFFLLSFIGDFSSVVITWESLVSFPDFIYILGYTALILYVIPKLVNIRLDRVVGIYLIIVISINSYFIYELFDVLKMEISNITEVNLFVVKTVSLLALVFISFIVYLNSDTKQTILFLFATLSFMFSHILHYVSNYYIYDWSFDMLNNVLHAVGLFFLLNYVMGENRLRKRQLITDKLNSELTTSS